MSAPPSCAAELAELLVSQQEVGRSGILTASRGKLKRLFCLQDGHIVFVASNVIEEQPGEFLVQRGVITSAECAAAARASAETRQKLSQVLLEGGVAEDRLREAIDGLIRSLLSSSLEWPEGSFRFEPGTPRLDGEVTARVAPVEAIVAHVQRGVASADRLRAQLGRPDDRPGIVAERQSLLDGLDLGPAAVYLLQACDGMRTLGHVLGESPEDEEATVRSFYALILVGLISPDAGGAGGVERVELTREMVEARLARGGEGTDHYTVLGLDRKATSGQVRDAYYQLARGMHPDRFRSGEMQDLFDRVESFFTLVTEAYNTLYDPDRRREYNRILDEGAQKQAAAPAKSEASFLARENYARGKELVAKKRYTEALTFLENAVRLDGTQPDYFLALGLLLSRNPRMRHEAEQNLLEVTRLEPASTRAYMALGFLYRRSGRLDDAARMYGEVLRWEPGHADAAQSLRELGVDPRSARKNLSGG